MRTHLTRRLAALAVGSTAAALLAALPAPAALAGAVGSGETVISGTTVSAGVGESAVTALPDGRFLAVWEGIRSVTTGNAQGYKREIFGRLLDATGAPSGEPVLLVSLGGADDATQDAADPALVTLSNGKVALAFAGDVKPDTAGAPTPNDLTNWQIHGAIIDPAAPLARLTPTRLTSEGYDAANPANSDAAYDQQAPDVVEDHGALRLVWQGDTPATGDGKIAVRTATTPLSLAGLSFPIQLSEVGRVATRPRVATLRDTGTTPDSMVAWEDDNAGQRSVGWARLRNAAVATSGTLNPNGGQFFSPDVAADAEGYLLAHETRTSGSVAVSTGYYSAASGSFVGGGTSLRTTGAYDAWPSVVADPSVPGGFGLTWVQRTGTNGTGHYEVLAARAVRGGAFAEVERVSSVDGSLATNNVESLRPAVAAAGGRAVHVWSRIKSDGTPAVATRSTATRADLTTSVTMTPFTPASERAGINPGDQVTVTVAYGVTAASTGGAPASISLALPDFVLGSASVSAASGPVPVVTGNPLLYTVGALAPGQGGTITFRGRFVDVADGATRTATATIAALGVSVDDPPTNNTGTASVTIDNPPAIVSATRMDPSPTNASSLRWKFTFSESVTGVDASDFAASTVGPVSLGLLPVSGSGTDWVASLSDVEGEGTVSLRLAPGATITGGGKPLATGNLPFESPAYTVDTVAPSVITTALDPDPSNASPLRFQLKFSEPVSRPDAAQLTVTNGTVLDVTGGAPGTTYTATVTPAADGPVSLTARAGAAADAVGNPSTAGTTVTVISDRTGPSVAVTGPTTPQRGAYDVTVTTDATGGLDVSDLEVTGGQVTGIDGTSSPFTVHVEPQTEGDVTVAVKAGTFTDAVGNASVRAAHTVAYDVTRPGVTVSSAASATTGDNPIEFSVQFTEPVTGLVAGDLDVTGGTATLGGSGRNYTVSVVPSADGPVSVGVPAAAATDAAGNPNTAGAAVTRTYDGTGPVPTITFGVPGPTNAATIPVRITWDEDVTGFNLADVSVNNGTLRDFTGSGRTYSATLTPGGEGQVNVLIHAGVANDEAGNGSLAATPKSIGVDWTPPTVSLTTSVGDPTNYAVILVTASFSEQTTGLAREDILVTNGTVSNLSTSNGGETFTFLVAPSAEGPVAVQIPAGSAIDWADNPNLASNVLSRTVDRTASAALTYAGPALVNAPVAMTLTLSDDATLGAADLVVDNGSVTLTGGPRVYDVVLTPTADGESAVRLPAGAFTDAAGNTSTASERVAVTYDATRPTATVTLPAHPTSAFQVPVHFSEPVAVLDLAGVVVTNGTASGLNGSGADWTFTVTPTADGPVTVALSDGAARDAAGNLSVAWGPGSTTYDSTPPTVTLSSPASGVVTTSPVPVTITFSEDVNGFGLGDLRATNATVTNLSGGGYRWTVDVVPDAEGEFSLALPAGAATDAAGHPARAGNTLVWEYDSTRPTLALTTTVAAVTSASTIPVTARFSKAVEDFAADDLVLTGATVSGFTRVDRRTWTFDLTPTADGTVGVEVKDGAAASSGGFLAFGAKLSVVVDRTAPVLTLKPRPSTTDTVVFDLAASETVTGLDETDLTLGGSARPTAFALTRVDATHWTVSVSGMAGPGDVEVAVREGAVVDAAGNASGALRAATRWSSPAELRRFALLQAPGARSENRVALPVAVVGGDEVSLKVTSSNPKLLPASAVTLTGSGAVRQLTLAGRARAKGRSNVVVRATAGGVTRTLRFTFIVGGKRGERLVGTKGVDVILARQGDDTVLARGGNDHVYAGQGVDRIEGGPGRDLLVGPSRDVIVGGAGKDVFVVGKRTRILDRTKGEKILKSTLATQD